MGKYVNNMVQNIIGWGSIAILVGLSVMLILLPLFQK
jgi:Mn2+/Fe2+ NRAMP family transporter